MLRRVMRFLALIICCGLLVPLGASPAQAEPTELSAADRFGACVAGTGSGDLLFLMDQSSSLAPPDGSDPQAARVAAAKYLLDVLTESAVAGQLDLSVKIDGFDAEYRPGNDWTQLSMSTLRQLQRDADAFADRNQGWATDYWLALEGARKTLAARAEGTEQNCFAVLFFTDGALTVARSSSENDFYRVDRPYDPTNPLVTPQDKQRAAEAATESLCRAGGCPINCGQ